MTENLLPKTRLLIERSAFGQHLSEFCTWLQAERYSAWTTHLYVLRLEQTLPRMCAAGPGELLGTDDLATAFDSSRGPQTRRKCVAATRRVYMRFLQSCGRLRDDMANNRFSALLQAYDRHLSELRGLSGSSRGHHAQTVSAFLAHTVGPKQSLSAITQSDVERFVARRSQEVSRHSMQHVVAYLRAFLRYCRDHGHIKAALDIIDTPRTYRAELPPKALPWSIVERLLASIDHKSKSGWRDHCLLHLLANYGLRPSEVVALRLDSIDWGAGILRIHQRKTGTELLLPLAPLTLKLLKGYFEHDRLRRTTADSELFLRARCPFGALRHYAVNDIFEKRMRLAHLACPQPGHVYSLRHTFAMRLLTRGVGLKAIGDVLGHRRLDSTCTYLRLDIDMLRDVALEVPNLRYQESHHA